MTFAEKLKSLRKQIAISQEDLADKVHVSRQAITKWENGNGLPDIENIVAIAALFNVSIDELLSGEKTILTKRDFLYESRTEYDLDEEKHLDLKIGVSHEIIIEKTKDEKIQILLASNKMSYLAQQVKVKIRETKRRMDVEVTHTPDLTDTQSKEDLFIFFRIPEKFVADLEINAIAELLRVRDITFDCLEFSGKLKKAVVSNASGHIELDTSNDLDVTTDGFTGKIDFNQIRATSTITVDSLRNYHAKCVGMKNHIIDNGKSPVKAIEANEVAEPIETDLIIELAGISSELTIKRAE